MKKGISFCVASVLCLSLLMGCGKATAPQGDEWEVAPPPVVDRGLDLSDHMVDDYVLCAQQGDLKLYVQPSTTAFYVENIYGEKWFSCPENRDDDWFADGIFRMDMSSTLVVNYVDPDIDETSRFNTFTGSVYDDAYMLRTLETGFRVDYSFPEYGVKIPMCVYLDNGDLKVEVVLKEIEKERENFFISTIAVLPFFGAGAETDEGYILVADGVGGIIRFNNGKYTSEPYARPIFGQEPSELPESYDLTVDETAIRMPVFGIRRNDTAFLAVVEEGVASGTLRAYTNLQQTGYANAYVDFTVKNQMDYNMGNIKTPLYETGEFSSPLLGIRYRLLRGENADYSGMARSYRSYLLDNGAKAESNPQPALYLNVVGGVSKTVSHLGIQSEQVVALTTLSQLEEITNWLSGQGVSQTVVRYTDWNEQELMGETVTSMDIASSLTKGGYTFEQVEKDGVTLYPSIDSFFTFSEGGFLKKTFDTACDISGVSFRWKAFSPGLGDGKGDTFYRLSAEERIESMERLSECLTECGKLSLTDVGNSLYNDFSGEGTKRDAMAREMSAWLARQSGDVMLSNPNIYAAISAKEIANAPIAHSGQDLIDATVPFYSIAMSGLKRFAGQAINTSGDDAFLQTVECGSMPTYTWIYADASVLKNTNRSELSRCGYQLTREQAVMAYEAANAVYSHTNGAVLYAHDILAENVSVTKYENGAQVYVNYRYEDYFLEDGTKLPARSYVIG